MPNRKTYLLISSLGLITMAVGQFISRPRFYGIEFVGRPLGHSWAHVFWLGFILLIGSLLTWFSRYIAHHKNQRVVNAGKFELLIIFGTTLLIGFLTVALAIYEKLVPSYGVNHVTVTGWDGDGRRGMFVLWVLLIIVFTIINLVLALRKHGHFRFSK